MKVESREIDRLDWRLLPSEQVEWHGRRAEGTPRDWHFRWGSVSLFALSAVFLAFAGLLVAAELEGAREHVLLSAMLGLFGIAVSIAPRYLHDPCEYLITDRRVVWRLGRVKRSIDRHSIQLARITWHRSVAGVGHLELVRVVPFGPLARKQRLLLRDVRSPDALLAYIRGVERSRHAGDNGVPMVERLDPDEQVQWGGRPEGALLGARDVATAVLGVATVAVGLRYGYYVSSILLELEESGLAVRSWIWFFFFVAVAISWILIFGVGVWLVWHGVVRARALGRDTDYLLTDRRLLIRRGRTELSVDRRRIVDVAQTRGSRGTHHLYLLLDAPGSKALSDSGALRTLPPSRDAVAPVLFEIRDPDRVRRMVLGRFSRPSVPPVRDAA